MYRVIVLYGEEPDADSYADHAELCRQVPNAVFRHGKVTGAPMGDPPHAYYAEWEFPDKEAFDTAVRSEEFMARLSATISPEWGSIETESSRPVM